MQAKPKSVRVIPMPDKSKRLQRVLRPAALRYCQWWEVTDKIKVEYDNTHAIFTNVTAEDSFCLPLVVDPLLDASTAEMREALLSLLNRRSAA